MSEHTLSTSTLPVVHADPNFGLCAALGMRDVLDKVRDLKSSGEEKQKLIDELERKEFAKYVSFASEPCTTPPHP